MPDVFARPPEDSKLLPTPPVPDPPAKEELTTTDASYARWVSENKSSPEKVKLLLKLANDFELRMKTYLTEARRTSQKWMDGICEEFGQKISFDPTGTTGAPTMGAVLKDLRARADAFGEIWDDLELHGMIDPKELNPISQVRSKILAVLFQLGLLKTQIQNLSAAHIKVQGRYMQDAEWFNTASREDLIKSLQTEQGWTIAVNDDNRELIKQNEKLQREHREMEALVRRQRARIQNMKASLKATNKELDKLQQRRKPKP